MKRRSLGSFLSTTFLQPSLVRSGLLVPSAVVIVSRVRLDPRSSSGFWSSLLGFGDSWIRIVRRTEDVLDREQGDILLADAQRNSGILAMFFYPRTFFHAHFF